jgi:hypothetical protein
VAGSVTKRLNAEDPRKDPKYLTPHLGTKNLIRTTATRIKRNMRIDRKEKDKRRSLVTNNVPTDVNTKRKGANTKGKETRNLPKKVNMPNPKTLKHLTQKGRMKEEMKGQEVTFQKNL